MSYWRRPETISKDLHLNKSSEKRDSLCRQRSRLLLAIRENAVLMLHVHFKDFFWTPTTIESAWCGGSPWNFKTFFRTREKKAQTSGNGLVVQLQEPEDWRPNVGSPPVHWTGNDTIHGYCGVCSAHRRVHVYKPMSSVHLFHSLCVQQGHDVLLDTRFCFSVLRSSQCLFWHRGVYMEEFTFWCLLSQQQCDEYSERSEVKVLNLVPVNRRSLRWFSIKPTWMYPKLPELLLKRGLSES